MRRALPAAALALTLAAASPALALPSATSGRQLQLATAHLAASLAVAEPGLPDAALSRWQALAEMTETFRWGLEYTTPPLDLEVTWVEMVREFAAARAALPADLPREVRLEVLRVHSLMNRVDRGFGGTGIWYGPGGWSG
jgi:hypothetical protein